MKLKRVSKEAHTFFESHLAPAWANHFPSSDIPDGHYLQVDDSGLGLEGVAWSSKSGGVFLYSLKEKILQPELITSPVPSLAHEKLFKALGNLPFPVKVHFGEGRVTFKIMKDDLINPELALGFQHNTWVTYSAFNDQNAIFSLLVEKNYTHAALLELLKEIQQIDLEHRVFFSVPGKGVCLPGESL